MAEGDVFVPTDGGSGGGKPGSGLTKFQEDAYSLGKAIGEAATIGVGAGGAGKIAGKAVESLNQVKDLVKCGGGDSIVDKITKKGGEVFDKCWGELTHLKPKVTDEDRKSAKEQLAREISPLISEPDAKMLSSLQDAVINGDLAKLSENLNALRQNPQKMDAFVKELNRELKEHNAGLELVSTMDRRVFVCGNGGTAIELGRDGNVQLRSVERRLDGSIVVNPGEVVGDDAGKLMKTFGNDVVRSMTRRYDYIKPLRLID